MTKPGEVEQALAAAPAITSFSPAKGVQDTLVTINGSGFVSGAAVSFNGTPSLSVTFVSSARLRAVVPPSSTSGPIVVSTPLGSATSATPFLVLPKVASFSPSQGFVGDVVTVSGSGLTAVTSVKFGAVEAAFTVSSDTSVTAAVPSGFAVGKLTLTTPQGSTATASSFSVLPIIAGFSPSQGLVGQSVSLTGAGFGIASAVKFGTKAAAFTVVSDTEISTAVPSGATTSKITVETPRGNRTSSASFTVLKLPTISSITPATSALPVTLTVNGANFGGTTSVKVGELQLPSFTLVSSSRITAEIPDWTPSGRVAVTTAAGTAVSAATFVAIQCGDQDGDHVCDEQDRCAGFDDHLDADADGVPDGCDVCPSASARGTECAPGLACDAGGACSVELVCDESAQGPGVLHGDVFVDGVNTAADLQPLVGKWCVTGNLSVSNTALHDLTVLADLVEVGGNFGIGAYIPGCMYPCTTGNPSLESLDGLQQLRRVGGYLHLQEGYGSPGIKTLAPLASLKTIGDAFWLDDTHSLVDLHGIERLQTLQRFIVEYANALTSLNGIQNLRHADFVRVGDAPVLEDMTALSGITSVADELSVYRTGLHSLAGLEQVTSAGNINIADNPNITELTPLANVSRVSGSFSVGNMPGVTSLAPLSGLTSVTDFAASGLGISSLDGLQNLDVTRSFSLMGNNALVDLSAIARMQGVGSLWIEGNQGLTSLASLAGLGVQTDLWLIDNPVLADCGNPVLGDGANVYLRNNVQLASLSCLAGKSRLGQVMLMDDAALTDLDELAALTTLDGNLYIINDVALTSLMGLSNLTSVRTVVINGEPLLVDLSGLQGVTSVYDLSIENNANLSSLRGLEGLTTVEDFSSFDSNPQLPPCAIARFEAQIGHPVDWNQGNTGTGACSP